MLCVIYVRGWGQEGKGPVFVPSLLAASGETLGRSDTKEVKAVRLDWESVMKCEAIVDNLWQDNAVQIQFSDFGSAGNQSQIQISEAQWLKTAGGGLRAVGLFSNSSQPTLFGIKVLPTCQIWAGQEKISAQNSKVLFFSLFFSVLKNWS